MTKPLLDNTLVRPLNGLVMLAKRGKTDNEALWFHPNHRKSKRIRVPWRWIEWVAIGVILLVCGAGIQAQITIPVPPLNDQFAGASSVTGANFDLTADLGAATREDFEPFTPCLFGHTAWWTWTAPQTGICAWAADTNTNAVAVTVYRQDSFHQLVLVEAPFWKASTNRAVIAPYGSFPAEKDITYYLQLDIPADIVSGIWWPFLPFDRTYPAHAQFACITNAAPLNDAFEQRATLKGSNAVFSGNLFAATGEPGEPRLPGDAMLRTLWWHWDAPGQGTARLQCLNPKDIPVVGIFQRGQLGQLQLVTCSGTEFGNSLYRCWRARTELRWQVAAGQSFEIAVDRYPEMDPAADFAFTLDWIPPQTNDNYATPQWLAGTDISLVVSNTFATHTPDETLFYGTNFTQSAWFAWRATDAGVVQISTDEPVRFDDPSWSLLPIGSVVIYQPSDPWWTALEDLHPLPPFIPVWGALCSGAHSTNIAGPSEQVLWADASLGDELRICLGGKAGTAGETPFYFLLTPPPANDHFTNRIRLPSAPVQVKGRTFAASIDATDPWVAQLYIAYRSVWWEWQAPSAGIWALQIGGQDGSNLFAIYRGAKATHETEIKHGQYHPLLFDAAAGEFFQIGVFSSQISWGGNVEFTLTQAVPPGLNLRRYTPGADFSQSLTFHILPQNPFAYWIESSTDLANWTPVWTNGPYASEELELTIYGSSPHRFFRTRLRP